MIRGFLLVLGTLTLVFLLVVFQVSLLNQAFFFSNSPNLILILPFAAFSAWGPRASVWMAFLGGFLYDILSLRSAGLTSTILLSFLVFYFLIRRFFSASAHVHLLSFYSLAIVFRTFFGSTQFSFSHLTQGGVEVLVLVFLTILFKLLSGVFGSSNYIQLKFEKL